jgi:hypothetical protein
MPTANDEGARCVWTDFDHEETVHRALAPVLTQPMSAGARLDFRSLLCRPVAKRRR